VQRCAADWRLEDAVRSRGATAVAPARGIREGQGPGTIDAAQVGAMKAQELGASEIAKALKIGRASVYRVLEAG
jgi:DNA invertase Pin-like site-specific DNA recombinase